MNKKRNIIDYLWLNSEYGVFDGILNKCCSAFLSAARRALRLCILSFSIIDCKHNNNYINLQTPVKLAIYAYKFE